MKLTLAKAGRTSRAATNSSEFLFQISIESAYRLSACTSCLLNAAWVNEGQVEDWLTNHSARMGLARSFISKVSTRPYGYEQLSTLTCHLPGAMI